MTTEPDQPAADEWIVEVSDLIVATPDASDPLIDRAVRHVLQLLREQHLIDAAFVGEVIEGNRIRRRTAPAPSRLIDESSDPLDFAFCSQVIKPGADTGCYLRAPVVLADGGMYGTLYAFTYSGDERLQRSELKKLELTAQLAARLINERGPAEYRSGHAPLSSGGGAVGGGVSARAAFAQ